jgi:hypothetical protein
MDEVVPVILGSVFGAVLWRSTSGRTRFALSVVAVILAGGAATLLSGEYIESWLYLLLDFGEGAFGLFAGIVLAARRLPRRTTREPAPAPR